MRLCIEHLEKKISALLIDVIHMKFWRIITSEIKEIKGNYKVRDYSARQPCDLKLHNHKIKWEIAKRVIVNRNTATLLLFVYIADLPITGYKVKFS